MIILAMLGTLIAIAMTILAIGANGMSSSPTTPFQGGSILFAAWGFSFILWLAWWFN